MVSEDSDQLSPGLSAVHRLDDFGNVRETRVGPVDSLLDHRDTTDELLKVALLR